MINRKEFLKGIAAVVAWFVLPVKKSITEREPKLKVVCDESQIANFVSVSFDGIECSNGIWFRDGRVYYTEPAFDKKSIKKYGMKIEFVYGGPLTLKQANALRDTYLNDHAWPIYRMER